MILSRTPGRDWDMLASEGTYRSSRAWTSGQTDGRTGCKCLKAHGTHTTHGEDKIGHIADVTTALSCGATGRCPCAWLWSKNSIGCLMVAVPCGFVAKSVVFVCVGGVEKRHSQMLRAQRIADGETTHHHVLELCQRQIWPVQHIDDAMVGASESAWCVP